MEASQKRALPSLLTAVGVVALLGLGFMAGRISAPVQVQTVVLHQPQAQPVDFERVQVPELGTPSPDIQAPPDPREMIPLGPGPGQGPGQQPGQGEQPGQGQGEECPILIYQDGQLFQLQPQQLPGQQPGQGQGPGPGMGGPQELIPLGPGGGGQPSPNTPTPQTPSSPQQPNTPAVPNPNRS